MRNIKLADEQRKMRLKAQQLNLKVRLDETKRSLSSTNAQLKAMRKPRKVT